MLRCGPRLFNKLPLAATTISLAVAKPQQRESGKAGKSRKKEGSQANRRTRSRKTGCEHCSAATPNFCFWLFRLSVCSHTHTQAQTNSGKGKPLVAFLCVTFSRFFGFQFTYFLAFAVFCLPFCPSKEPSHLLGSSQCLRLSFEQGFPFGFGCRCCRCHRCFGSRQSNKQIDLFPVAMLSVGSAGPGRKQNGVSLVNVV